MNLILNRETDPYRNMATEEYLLRTAPTPTLMLWRNAPAVIIGRNQDARAEVDFAFAKAHGIAVVRRLSGGGAVFHDLGNLNYTFIVPNGMNHASETAEFGAMAEPILDALRALGISAKRAGRNDLVARTSDEEWRKFSGTAECLFRRDDGMTARMHHGTLLFSADFSALAGVLTPERDKLASKGIKSVRARVVNLQTLLPAEAQMDISAFTDHLAQWFLQSGAHFVAFTEKEKAQIAQLAADKYAGDAWLFGKFGAHDRTARRRFPYGTVAISFATAPDSEGRPALVRVAFSGDFFGEDEIDALETALLGTPVERNTLTARLAALALPRFIKGAAADEIASLFCEAE